MQVFSDIGPEFMQRAVDQVGGLMNWLIDLQKVAAAEKQAAQEQQAVEVVAAE